MSHCGFYARTSTSDKQDPEMQLREYAKLRNWNVEAIYEDKGYTGTNANRPMLKKLLQDAKARRFELVAVWKLDRFGRSLQEIILMLQDLADYGVEFCSLKDALNLSTSQERLMVHIIAAFAQFEADMIRTRVIAGLENAKAQGKKLGRPKERDNEAARKLRLDGLSLRAIAARLDTSKGSVQNALRPSH
jgi:DNA invertase Pin-like site-specific DNA recombinase